MDNPATPADTLMRANVIAREQLDYVYVGNIFLEGLSDTHCPQCDSLLVRRSGYATELTGIDSRKCSSCGKEVDFRL